MRIAILSVLMSFVLSGCGQGDDWYYGVWVVDEPSTRAHTTDKELLAMAERSMARSKDMIISITEKTITFRQDGRTWGQGYEVIEVGDGTVLLVENGQGIRLGKDDYGVFLAHSPQVSEGGAGESRTFKVYLMEHQ